ncbi:MAG: DUF697 domain-containing protein [Phaeodactylibacter sp.]|uniref:DUF697 domain-containing protein n=1 Tax=Phaeodactylibacter sp. TaxID=1940289 RepID=UPI0032EF7820
MEPKEFFDYGIKKVKSQFMSESTSERGKHVDTIIRNHVVWSMGSGLIPILIADIFAISAVQLDMIRQMSKVYNVDFSETQGKAIVTSLTSSTLARIGAGSLAKMIPVVGSVIGGITVSIFAGASTYALGQVFKRHYESGGTILDFDPARLKKMYKEQFEKGKKVAEQLRKDKAAQKAGDEAVKDHPMDFAQPDAASAGTTEAPKNQEDVIERLKSLGKLRDEGIISEEEFQSMKAKLIQSF